MSTIMQWELLKDQGTCGAKKYAKWIVIDSFGFSASRGINMLRGDDQIGNYEKGSPYVGLIEVSKKVDGLTDDFYDILMKGTKPSKVEFVHYEDEDATLVTHLHLTLVGARIGSVDVSISNDGFASEQLTFGFKSIEIKGQRVVDGKKAGFKAKDVVQGVPG